MPHPWKSVIEELDDPLVVIDRQRHVQWANRSARQLSDWGDGDLPPNLPCYVMVHGGQPCTEEDCNCPVPEVLETGQSVRAIHHHPSNNGEAGSYFEVVASPLHDEQKNIQAIVELRRDITHEYRLRQEVMRRNRELTVLNRVMQAVGQSLDLESVLSTALEEVLHLTGLDMGAIFVLRRQTGRLELLSCRNLSTEAGKAIAELRLAESPCGMAVSAGQPLVIPDVTNYRGKKWSLLRSEDLCAFVHVPLLSKGEAMGSLCVGRRQPYIFPEGEVSLLSAVASQIAMAVENARLYHDLEQKERVRRELLHQAITAQEDERCRIARGLHDETSQTLTALLYSLEAVSQMPTCNGARENLVEMQNLVRNMLDGTHRLIHDLRPTLLDHLGLLEAIRWLAEKRLGNSDIHVHTTKQGEIRRVDGNIATVVFRVAQEAISNIANHAAARNAWLTFQFQPEHLTVTLADDGIGFDPTTVQWQPGSPRGLGLVGMEERMDLIGGQLSISSAPQQGCEVRIDVPLEG
ncbi:MAG: GAF domain-containing protein [Chloroflexi bacterium]|nr:GAF domain-containing protein [Chloroflexota bacterium]